MMKINNDYLIRELMKIAKIVEADDMVRKPPTHIVGLIGELMVLRKLFALGYKPRYTSRQGQPDIVLGDKKIEVKTSHVNIMRKRDGYQSGNANIKISAFDFLILVSISKDWSRERFFVLTNEDVLKVKLDKRDFGEKEGYVAIRYFEDPKTKDQKKRNKLMESYEDTWEKLTISVT